MKNTIRSLIIIILLSLVALFLRRKINPDEIELETTNEPPDLKVVKVEEDEIIAEINDEISDE